MRIISCGMKSLGVLMLILAASVGQVCSAQSTTALTNADAKFDLWKTGTTGYAVDWNGEYVKGVYSSFEYSVIAADASWDYCEELVDDITALHNGLLWGQASLPGGTLASAYVAQKDSFNGTYFAQYVAIVTADSDAQIAQSAAWDANYAWDNWDSNSPLTYAQAAEEALDAQVAYVAAVDDYADAVAAGNGIVDAHNTFVEEVLVPLGDYVEYLLDLYDSYINAGYWS